MPFLVRGGLGDPPHTKKQFLVRGGLGNIGCHSIQVPNSPPSNLQSDILKMLGQDRNVEPLETLLARKAVTTFGAQFALNTHMRPDWFLLLKEVLADSKAFLRVCWLASIAGAWCTTHRMNEGVKWPCIFGCNAQDKLCHYLTCFVLWHFATSLLGAGNAIFVADRLCLREPSVQKLRTLASVHLIYHSCKNDSEVQNLLSHF